MGCKGWIKLDKDGPKLSDLEFLVIRHSTHDEALHGIALGLARWLLRGMGSFTPSYRPAISVTTSWAEVGDSSMQGTARPNGLKTY